MRKLLVDGVLLGCDPEIFLYSENYLKYVPVCGLVGGTKEVPIHFTEKGHALQEDNVLLEFCVPPSKAIEEWLDNIKFTKDFITNKVLKPLELVPHYKATARFNEDDLKSEQAIHMGCDPSYNAYTLKENKVDRTDLTLRTSSGHIHIGYNNPDMETSLNLVKAFDLFLGVPSVLIDPDNERRKMYGKAGEHRLKPYGKLN